VNLLLPGLGTWYGGRKEGKRQLWLEILTVTVMVFGILTIPVVIGFFILPVAMVMQTAMCYVSVRSSLDALHPPELRMGRYNV